MAEDSTWSPKRRNFVLGAAVIGSMPLVAVFQNCSRGFAAQSNNSGAGSPAGSTPNYNFLNVLSYGADPSGTNDSTSAIQSAISAAAGKTVYFPAGTYLISKTLSSSVPIHLLGDGCGMGPGTSTTAYASVLIAATSFGSGDMISVNSAFGSMVENLQFNSLNSPRSSGAALQFYGPNPETCAGVRVRNCAFINQFNCISEFLCVESVVEQCLFLSWANSGFINAGTSAVECGGGHIRDNYFFGNATPTSSCPNQLAAMEIHSGYVNIYRNLIEGAQFGVLLKFDTHASGAPFIDGNWIEDQIVSGIYALNGNGIIAAMMQITNNDFSVISNGARLQTHIALVAGSANWVTNVNISGNTFQSALIGAGQAYISIQSGQNVLVANNLINSLSQTSSAVALATGSQAGGVVLRDNLLNGNFPVTRYTLASGTILIDRQGMPFSTLVNLGNLGNGSEVNVTDGQATSASNVLVTGNGSGCLAWRMRGQWVTLPLIG